MNLVCNLSTFHKISDLLSSVNQSICQNYISFLKMNSKLDEIQEEANVACEFLLPEKSEKRYQTPYKCFKEWCLKMNSTPISLGNLSGAFGNVPIPVALTFSQLYWISAIVFLIGSTVSGSTRVIIGTFRADELWKIIEKYKITIAFLSPFQCMDFSKTSRPEGVDTSSLYSLATGGGPISEMVVHSLRDILPGTFIMQLYGQTEVCGASTMFQTRRIDDQLLLHYKPKSVGRLMPGFWFKVVDIETEEILGPKASGELRIKSDFLMNGYFRRDCSDAYDKNGWFKTGDVAYYDEFQCFYIIDRIKELLKYRGWHVQPVMLENLLMLHPAVRKAVVVGVPDEEDGDHPLGLVVLNEDYLDIDTKELEEFVEERVQDRQRLRAGVKIIKSIPITNTGKIKRLYLRNAVIKGEI